MRAVIQRVNTSQVMVSEEVVGAIGKGLTVLLGVEAEDTMEDVKYMADKIVNLRIFEDLEEKMNLSLIDVSGQMLCVSQFTLLGDCRKGRRPNFMAAAKPEHANNLYEAFVCAVEAQGVHVETGKFQAHMVVDIQNDGPVTVLLDSKRLF